MEESEIQKKMEQVVDLVQRDLSSIRTGRASNAIVSDIVVAVYGGSQRLKIQEVANITASDPQTIVIDPWDKSIIGEIKQGILASQSGLNPSIDSDVIRISIPPLTTEDREKYVKLLGAKVEAGKVMIRQVRGDAMHDIKKSFEEKQITEDDKFREEKKLQEITDEFIGKIDSLAEAKKAEIESL